MTNTPVQPMGTLPDTQPAAPAPGVVAVSTGMGTIVTETKTETKVIPPVAPNAATDTVPPSTTNSAPKPPNKKMSRQVIFGVIALIVLVAGAIVGSALLNKNSDLRQQASEAYTCAGGVAAGATACSGFREVVKCTATGFEHYATCLDIAQCGTRDDGTKGCVNSPAQSCAGGIPDKGKACDTLHSVVTCNNGQFSSPASPCPTVGGVQQICSNGICGGTNNSGACAVGVGDTTCQGRNPGATCQIGTVTGACNGNAGGACLCRVASTTPTPSPVGGACAALGSSCNDTTSLCCSNGACQGVGSNRRCEAKQDTCTDPTGNSNGVCGGSNGWLGFKCNNLTSGQCLENSATFSSYGEALAYASSGGCGQVDEVCNGGYKNRQLCGSFQVIAESCGGSVSTPPPSNQPSPIPTPVPSPSPSPIPTPTPGVTPSPIPTPIPTPSPSPMPSPAPVCAYIAASKAEIRAGDDISFTCGIIPGASKYEFRVQLPDGTISNVNPVSSDSNISELFHVASTGNYKAQCRICVGPAAVCQEWETL